MFAARRAACAVTALALVVTACAGDDDDTAATTGTAAGPAATTPATEPGATDPAPTEPGATGPATTTDDGDPVVVTLPPDTTPDPVPGGTFRFGMNAEVDGLNPTTSAMTAAPGLAMAAAVFDKLADYTPDGSVVPYLAASFTPNADYTTWDVGLREGVTFHDGTVLDAEAVRFNFAAQYESPLAGLALRTSYASAEAAEVLDPLTVRFHLMEPNAYWPAVMATQLGMMASPTWVQAALADPTLNQQPVGTGPFRFVSRSEDSVTRFERNPDWWNGEVYLDAVEFLPIVEATSRGDLLRGGDIDGFYSVAPETVIEFRDADGFTTMLNDANDESFFMLNMSVPPFDDIRVRQALAAATPREQYVQLIGQGVVRGADQMFIPESPFHNPDVHQLGDDPAQAATLVAEYCAERGTETNPITGGPTCTDGRVNIEYQLPGPEVLQTRIADLVGEGWGTAFNVQRQELLQDEHISQTVFGQYNAVIWQSFGATEPMLDGVWLSCRSMGALSLNFPRNCDEARDEVLLAAANATDPAERATIYQDLVRRINESFTYIFMTHTMVAQVFSDRVHGVCDRVSPEGIALACAVNTTIWPTSIWIE